MSMDRPRPLASPTERVRRQLGGALRLVAPAGGAMLALLLLIAVGVRVADRRLAQDAAAAAPRGGDAVLLPAAAPSLDGPAVTVEIPEAYELAHVVLSLTAFAERHPHTVLRRGAYWEEVRRHFAPYRDHPLVGRLNAELQGDGDWRRYLYFRESAAAWAFDGDRLVPSGRYPMPIFGGGDPFAEHRALVEDFAAATGFRAFHAGHRARHDDQVRRYVADVPLEAMWQWLEARFPQRYDRYRVVFSPLSYGTHSTQRYDGGGVRQTIMFVAGPDVPADTVPPAVRAAELARIVFTEIDHNYVNPTTDRHRAAVDAALADWRTWNQDPDRTYESAYATFNEYMTWGVFSLWARQAYDAPTFARVVADVERLMETRRGFVRFAAFNRELLRLYAERGAESPIPDLYEPMLDWARRQ